jgi:DNA-binding SARP family transcriptional activator/TolB-like protein
VIRINTLGGLSVRDSDGKPVAGAAAQPRRMAILALLARAGQRGITREKLLALLWPDADDERGPRTLAQALYALRKDLGAEDAITGSKELRFDPALVTSDVTEFASAVARGDDERAVALYHGPFLDGFHLSGANEFSRWVETERTALAQEHSRALESLARGARATGDARAALGWWRKLAGLEPLNARVTVGLMDALAAAGDRAAAIQHARIYELLVDQELDLPPDKDVLALAEQLRRTADEAAVATVATALTAQPAVAVAEVAAPVVTTFRPPEPALPEHPKANESRPALPPAIAPPAPVPYPPSPNHRTRTSLTVGLMAAMAIVIIGFALVAIRDRWTPHGTAATSTGPVVAVGKIAAFGTDSAQTNLTAPVADLLTTSLARVHAIRVVSHSRMLELMRSAGNSNDTSAVAFVNAARLAGATEVIDGTLYTRPGGRLRLDLRRTDVGTGAIGDVRTVEGSDLFALVDSGTTGLVAALGAVAPTGSVADVTTRSVTAYRMYEQGVRAYYRGDLRTSIRFFDGALAEDSLFALAAYYAALSDPVPASYLARMERARRLASRTSDVERLTILSGWAYSVSSPSFRAIAETLVTRYPTQVEGQLYSGIARVFDGEFLAGLEPLERTIQMDSLGLRGTRPRCAACDALQWRIGAYALADSLPASIREARRWVRLQPQSAVPMSALINILEVAERFTEADSLFNATRPADYPYLQTVDFRANHFIRAGDYASADRLLLIQLREKDSQQQANGLWNLTMSLREQGRMTEAHARAYSARVFMAKNLDQKTGPPPINVFEAQTLLEMGRAAEAAALFDSLSRQYLPGSAPSQLARATAWMLTQSAGARAAAGDTASLPRLADSVQALGEESGYGRDRRLHHYVRGLLLSARGDDAKAISEFRAAIYSMNTGFTRTNYQLARVYLRDKRPRDAIAVLQPTLRGALEASNLYLNRTEIHEMLAQAWDAAGVRDSAAAHYAWVTKAWASADPFFRPRFQAAQARLTALTR